MSHIKNNLIRWEKDTKYYQVIYHKDLLGDLVVLVMWGSQVSGIGRHKVIIVDSDIEAKSVITDIGRRRVKRGYALSDNGFKQIMKLNQPKSFNDQQELF